MDIFTASVYIISNTLLALIIMNLIDYYNTSLCPSESAITNKSGYVYR